MTPDHVLGTLLHLADPLAAEMMASLGMVNDHRFLVSAAQAARDAVKTA